MTEYPKALQSEIQHSLANNPELITLLSTLSGQDFSQVELVRDTPFQFELDMASHDTSLLNKVIQILTGGRYCLATETKISYLATDVDTELDDLKPKVITHRRIVQLY